MPERDQGLAMPVRLEVEHLADADAALRRLCAPGPVDVVVDLAHVESIDTAGAALLAVRARQMARDGRTLRITGARPAVAALLQMLPALGAGTEERGVRVGLVEQLGAATADGWLALLGLGSLFADTCYFTATTLLGKHRLRPGVVTMEMASIGSRALGVVGLIAFLVGATMALQSAAQLRKFGADLFVVDLVVLSMLRELGPLMAAIVVAGRSGSAIAAELGTMVVTEEVDALRTLGLDPIRFLVVPKILAFTLVQPLLTLYANVLGVLGGMVVAVFYLDIGVEAFGRRLEEQLMLSDLLAGCAKSVIFAWLIGLIGAYYGLATRGGAEAVGRSTTASVVAGIFAVVVADAVASIVLWF